MNVQFIEPCCASKQLPTLLREQKVAAFQTNGDVTFEHIMKAVSFLAGDTLSVKLMVPSINVDMLRILAWFGRRDWLKRLQVLTQNKQDELIRKEVSDSVPSVSCYHHELVVESLLVIEGEKGCVTVSGHFLTSVEPGHRFYNAAIGSADSDHVRMFTATLSPLMRNEDVPSPTPASQDNVDPEPEKSQLTTNQTTSTTQSSLEPKSTPTNKSTKIKTSTKKSAKTK